MTKTTIDPALARQLVVALNAHERAKSVPTEAEDNPFANQALEDMATAGLLKSADKHPALNMAPKGGLGADMELARNEGLVQAKDRTSTRRKAEARARMARKQQMDKIAEAPVIPDQARMAQAWQVIGPLFPTVVLIADQKRQWAARFLGDVTDDVASMVLENMALMLAKSDQDLEVLRIAAEQIASKASQPRDEYETEAQRKERKKVGKARKWLMQVVNNRVMDTLVDVYFRSQNLRWDNLDLMATVMANISGVGGDPLTARFKADRAPAFLGTKFQAPDGIDAGLIAAAISAAITERRLDPMVEFLLNEEHVDTSGRVAWSAHAETIFKLTPGDAGDWMWEAVVQATSGVTKKGKPWKMDRARKARGDAARAHVRRLFEFLPHVITGIVEAFDPHILGFTAKGPATALNHEGEPVLVGRTACDTRINAVLASEFELFYAPEGSPKREMLAPVLRYADTDEAVQALLEHLGQLVTGNDLLASAVNA